MTRPRDFGFDPDVSPHHFIVKLHSDGGVLIAEQHGWVEDGAAGEASPAQPKAILDAYRWERVAKRVALEFNGRLRAAGVRAARWKRGETLLAAHYGKELTLLAWAVDRQESTLIPNILLNWAGLAPEERWWLYTTVNATFVRPEDEPRGWRKAIRIALAENPIDTPVSAFLSAPLPVSPEDRATSRRGRRRREPPENQPRLDLPGLLEASPAYDPDEIEETDER
jgi:hypothetical protein